MNYFSKLRVLTVIALTIISLSAVEVSAQQNPRELFQRARMLEESNQNLGEAIKLYSQVISLANEQRALAAKAQLRMGLLYDRLSRKAEAQRAYQAVVNQYADQPGEARQARARIVVAAPPRNTNASAKTATGLTVRQVWAGSFRFAPAISPDERYLAYITENALFVRDLLNGKHRRLAEGTASPAFSPDGKLVAYRLRKSERDELLLIALDGSAPRVLNRSDEGAVLAPFEWSSDGKHILGGRQNQNTTNRQIVLVSVADGSVRVLKTLEDWGTPLRPSLSPDGRYVVYPFTARKDSAERDIFILATDGGREVPMVTQAADERDAVWTPDGRGILFLSARAGSTGAWFLRVVDGKPQGSPELVKRDMGHVVPIGFTRNGSLYYSERPEMDDLYTATLDPTTGTITGQPATVTQRLVIQGGVWSPNGQYLAYRSRRSSDPEGVEVVVIRSVQTGEEYELAPALRTIYLNDWSADSRFLLVTARDMDGRGGAYQVDARTGDVALLALTGGPGQDTANWFAQGKSIIFRRASPGDQRIVVRDLETGHETEWYRAPASLDFYSVEASADGRHLAFVLADRKKVGGYSLMVMTAAGEKPRELDPRLKASEEVDYILGFTPDGRHVLFNSFNREQKGSGYKYWRIAVEGGAPQEIRLQMGRPVYVEQMNFHPDGQRVSFTAHSWSASSKRAVWVMENFLPAPSQKKTKASSQGPASGP